DRDPRSPRDPPHGEAIGSADGGRSRGRRSLATLGTSVARVRIASASPRSCLADETRPDRVRGLLYAPGSRTAMRRIETVAAVLALAGCMSATPVAAARFAYVTNAFDDTVSILDARTGVTAATVAVGCAPRGAAALPDGSRVYVANTCLEDPDIVVDT